MVLADIPYGEVINKQQPGKVFDKDKLRNLDKGKAAVETFQLSEFLPGIARVAAGSVYIFCSIVQCGEVYTFFQDHPDFMVRQCVWKKTNPCTMNSKHLWLPAIEMCVFAKRRRTKFNAKGKHSVWDFPVGRSKLHPTEKPLKLFKYLIESSTDPGDMVFDPCLGSGTSAIAAIETGRRYLGCEIDEEYYEIAKNRINSTEFGWELRHEQLRLDKSSQP
jgi:DNA modification methylase